MKQQFSNTFNKEKLVFLGTAGLLAICVYHFMSSRPVALEVGIPVSPLPPPAPLTPDKPENIKGDVTLYIQSYKLGDQYVSRDRNNPFAPINDLKDLQAPPVAGGAPNQLGVKTPPPGPPPPPPPPAPIVENKKPEPKSYNPNDKMAKVDFSAVISMGGVVYGLVKDKEGKTFQVKVGDYMEDFKYTVSKIDKQAIWVTDENDREFVARDMSFMDDSKATGEDDDEKPKKKKKKEKPDDKKATKSEDKVAAAPKKKADATTDIANALAEVAKQMALAKQNQNPVINNDDGGRKRKY